MRTSRSSCHSLYLNTDACLPRAGPHSRNAHSLLPNREVAAAISRCPSVIRLVYTSSTASLKDCDLDAIRSELRRPDYLFRVDESRLPDPTNRFYTFEHMACPSLAPPVGLHNHDFMSLRSQQCCATLM